eukprot:4929684-Pleurochrysis_carterae.AAC.1
MSGADETKQTEPTATSVRCGRRQLRHIAVLLNIAQRTLSRCTRVLAAAGYHVQDLGPELLIRAALHLGKGSWEARSRCVGLAGLLVAAVCIHSRGLMRPAV